MSCLGSGEYSTESLVMQQHLYRNLLPRIQIPMSWIKMMQINSCLHHTCGSEELNKGWWCIIGANRSNRRMKCLCKFLNSTQSCIYEITYTRDEERCWEFLCLNPQHTSSQPPCCCCGWNTDWEIFCIRPSERFYICGNTSWNYITHSWPTCYMLYSRH